MLRWFAWIAGGLLVLLGLAWVSLGAVELGPLAGWAASRALGRPVQVATLRVTPGRWLVLELREARLDNLPGGSAQPMASIGRLSAEVDLLSLLAGPLAVRRLAVDEARLLLERDAGGTANWRFGPPDAAADTRAAAETRGSAPTLLQVALTASELTYRTTGGALLRVRLDRLEAQAADAAAPLSLQATGAYGAVPLLLRARLGGFDALRDAALPYPVELEATCGETSLRFAGHMTAPLDLDGARGELALVAPTPAVLLAVAGAGAEAGPTAGPALRLAGGFEHQGALWHWGPATGTLGDASLTAADLRLTEAPRGQPDAVAVALDFDRLNLNTLLGGGGGPQADFPLAVDRAPDTLLSARIGARRLEYAAVTASEARLQAALTPGRIAVEDFRLTYQGAPLRAAGQVEALADAGGGRVTAEVGFSGLEVQALRRVLGFGPLPVAGRLDGQAAVVAEGATLNAAARRAHLSAVVAMDNGSIERAAVEKASTDLRALFRTASGRSAISCLLGVLDIRAGTGTLSPLRIRAEHGTLAGVGQFDLYRRRLDLTVSSEAATTATLALDVPLRISGGFDSPAIAPAQWSAAGRAQLAAGDNLSRLLPALQPFARRSPCWGSRR